MAFKHLYLKYFPLLCRSGFRKIQDEELIEEIVQDIFVDLWRKRLQLVIELEIGAFLYALLRNKILHEWRARSVRAKHTEQFYLQNANATNDSLAETVAVHEVEEKLYIAINHLPAQCQLAFRLSRYDDLSYREISERMNISIKTVEKHIGKALKLLKLELKEFRLPIVILITLLLVNK